MQYLISAVLLISLLMIVEPRPMCHMHKDANHHNDTWEPTCYTNLTADVAFLREWLSLHDESEGIDQLRNRKDSSIASILLTLTTTMVILRIKTNVTDA